MKQLLIASLLIAPALLNAQTLTPPGPVTPTETNPPQTTPTVPAPPRTGATADSQKLTPEQIASIMKQLDQIEGVMTKNRDTTLGGALARCIKGESSQKDTLDLYLACYKAEHFDKINAKPTEFTDWAKHNEDKLKDSEFLHGLWLQLEFLVIAIKAQDADNVAPLVASLQNFVQKSVVAVQNATAAAQAGAGKEKSKGGPARGSSRPNPGQLVARLHESVRQSEFSKALLLKDYLKREDWEYEPLAIGSIYEKIIFPYYLEKKPAELPAQWDIRLKAELALKQALSSEAEYALFFKEHEPGMIWKKSKYLLDNNINTVNSLAAMLQVVRENPTNASAGEWLKELREAVNKIQPPAQPSPGLTAPSAPSETPAAAAN